MIQSILFFALGCLTAGFLALLVAPAALRRAAALSRKRVEASVPMTLDEIQADKDRIRAEYAMQARRLEISAKTLREKNAAQVIEIGRGREEIKALGAELAEKNLTIADLGAGGEGLRAELRRRDEELEQLRARLVEADETLKQKSLDVEKLGRMYEEASFLSSSRQIELVARESELEQLGNEAAQLRTRAKEAERRLQEAQSDAGAVREALKAETRKVDALEKKIAGMLATHADREERLEREARELAQLREELTRRTAVENELNALLVELQAEKSRLEAQLAEPDAPMSAAENGGDAPTRSADRERLENRLTALARENRKLKADLGALRRSQGETGGDGALREQIAALAAEMVHLTARLEGPDSPIANALSEPAAGGETGAKTSLADRVRALQKAASAG